MRCHTDHDLQAAGSGRGPQRGFTLNELMVVVAIVGIIAVIGMPVDSPDLRINVTTVKWTNHPDYTDWTCLVECRERDGCHAEVQLVVNYISSGRQQRLPLGGRLDSAYGETVRIGRAQRPSVKADRVERVTVQVVAAFHRDAPTPTPMV